MLTVFKEIYAFNHLVPKFVDTRQKELNRFRKTLLESARKLSAIHILVGGI